MNNIHIKCVKQLRDVRSSVMVFAEITLNVILLIWLSIFGSIELASVQLFVKNVRCFFAPRVLSVYCFGFIDS